MSPAPSSIWIRPAAVAAALTAFIFGGGCASFGIGGSSSGSSGCNAGITGAIGAAAGAVIGSGNRFAGAAVGGAVGALACVAYNYSTRQKRSADQVEKDYEKKQGTLPDRTQVLHYSAAMQPTNMVASGGSATLVSNVELVRGRKALEPNVEEGLEMRSPDGKVLNQTRKTAQAIRGSGEYENQFKFTLPQGVDEGIYPVDLTLYVDGERRDTKSVRMQVASNGVVRWLAAR